MDQMMRPLELTDWAAASIIGWQIMVTSTARMMWAAWGAEAWA